MIADIKLVIFVIDCLAADRFLLPDGCCIADIFQQPINYPIAVITFTFTKCELAVYFVQL